jgi:hypothetical protein
MRIKKSQLSRIIKEELQFILEGRGAWGQESRDLNRSLFQTFKDLVHEKFNPKSPPSEFQMRWGVSSPEVPAPKSAQKLGLEYIQVRIDPMSDSMKKKAPGPIFVGGAYSGAKGTAFADRGVGRPNIYPGTGAGITSRIYFDDTLIKTSDDFKKYFPEIYSNLQKNSYHELFHHRQFTTPGHPQKEPYTGMTKADIAKHPNIDPKKVAWISADPKKYPARSKWMLYYMSAHETDSQTRGFYKQAQKSKGKYTFEQLVDQRLKLANNMGDITDVEMRQAKNHWMAYAKKQLPCARLASGEFLKPAACRGIVRRRKKFFDRYSHDPKIKRQALKELEILRGTLNSAPKKPGVFMKILKKLPIIGRFFILGLIVHTADEAYAAEGLVGVAKVLGETAVDFTPGVGDVKAIADISKLFYEMDKKNKAMSTAPEPAGFVDKFKKNILDRPISDWW